jgi:putative ABC transport system substrate-binding protein
MTQSIPILFVTSESVADGLIASLSRPGENLSGVDIISGEITGKRFELLAALVPGRDSIGFLTNAKGIQTGLRIEEAGRAAEETGRRLLVVNASSEVELEAGLSKIADARVSGVVVQNDPFFDSQRDHLSK